MIEDESTDQCSRCPETLPDDPLHTFDGEVLCHDCEALAATEPTTKEVM